MPESLTEIHRLVGGRIGRMPVHQLFERLRKRASSAVSRRRHEQPSRLLVTGMLQRRDFERQIRSERRAVVRTRRHAGLESPITIRRVAAKVEGDT